MKKIYISVSPHHETNVRQANPSSKAVIASASEAIQGKKSLFSRLLPFLLTLQGGKSSCYCAILSWIASLALAMRAIHKKRVFTKIVIILYFVLLPHYSLNASAVVAKPPAKPRHLTVILDWFMNPDHAPLFVAKWQGFFAAQDLDVEWVNPADPADPPKWVAAGKADIAITYEPKFLIAQKQGLPLVWLATLVATPLDSMITLEDSGIRSIQDFKGKRIGYSSGEVDGVMLTRVLKQAGLSAKDVTLINIHYNLTQPLLAHQVDVVTGAMRNFEPTEIILAGQKPKLFYVEDYGVPNYEELILVTQRKEANDPALGKFTKALQQGTAYLINHPEESWQAFAKAYPELNNELNRRAWFETLPRFARRPTAYDAKAYEQMRLFLQQQGLL